MIKITETFKDPFHFILFSVAIVIPIFLTGCGSTRYYLKSSSLKDGDPYAEIRYGDNMQDGLGEISRVYTTTVSGETREYQIIDKDSVGKNAGKIAFSLTPLGMMLDVMDTTELSVLVPPGKIDLFIKIKGVKRVPSEADGREITLMSVWSHKLPVELEANSLYTIMNLGQLIVRSDNGKIVGRSTPDTFMEVREFNEKAFLLSKADRSLTERGALEASQLDVKAIPVYIDSDNTLVILSGSLDLGLVVSGIASWIPPNHMVLNVGRKPIGINGVVLNEGDYLLNQSENYAKASLQE